MLSFFFPRDVLDEILSQFLRVFLPTLWSMKQERVKFQMTDFTHILNLTVHIYCNLKKCKKKRKGTLFAILLPNRFALRRVHFQLTLLKNCISINLHAVCSRNAKRTYFIFRNDYLLPLQDRLKEDKKKKSRKNKKLSQQAHDVEMTSYWRQYDVVTSHQPQYDVILTSYTCWDTYEASQIPGGHMVSY